METKRLIKKIGTISLSTVMAFSVVPSNVFMVHAQETAGTYANDSATYVGAIASIDDIKATDNIVNMTTVNGEQIRLTFMSDTMFRFNLEPDGEFVEEPATNNPKYTGKMLVKPVSEYDGVKPTITEDAENYIIQTSKVALYINKTDSKMKMVNLETGVVEWSEKEPLQYGGGQTIQTLNTSDDEYYYGGGMQNGYFSHKNRKINIYDKADSGNWGDGMTSSPTPFYMSTTGYGVMRYTWATGVYDFDSKKEDTVKTTHNENRFDAIYFSGASLKDALNQYTEVTGRPVLMPEYGYYLGHANCYNRDYWVEDANGKYEFNGKRYTEKGEGYTGSDGILETLNNGPISARNVLDGYQDDDMPFGWFLPNDGYGCGYGQDDTDSNPADAEAEAIDINIANLKEFSDYANKKGVEVGLWTQSNLVPTLLDSQGKVIPPHLRRDFEKEVKNGGVKAIKTDVAWVGEGGAMALNSVQTAATTITKNTNYRPFVVSLFGWNGTQRYANIWSGDQTGGQWEYIRFHIPSYIGLSMSGNPNVGSDMDGIYGGGKPIIQTRDYQWKAFTPVQIDMDGWGNTIKNPAANGGEYASINRMYLKMKAEMLPYYYSAAFEANQTGTPLMRAMVLEYPDDSYAKTSATQYQYMWGENLLVAPIYQDTASDDKGNDIRNNIYLPDENQVWIDYFTGEQYQGGSVLNNFDAPVWKLPLFVKNGAIIPMTEENNSPKEIAKDATRRFDVYPSGKTDYDLFEDDGNTTNFENGKYAITNITSDAPVTGEGTATITINKAVTKDGSDYTTATTKEKQRATEVYVNVQKAPESVTAKVGNKDVALTEAKTLEEYNNSENTYFYNEKPNLNKYNLEGETFSDTEIITGPKVYVKLAKTDVSANDVVITVNGFNNTQASGSDGMSEAPSTPTNLAVDEENLTDHSVPLTWDAVEGTTNGATSYDLRIGGENGMVFSNILSNTFTHEDLAQDTAYTYEVRAVNSVGASAWSAPIETKTLLDPWRNVPAGMTAYSEEAQNGSGTSGSAALVNRNTGDMWFSKFDPSVITGPKTVVVDLKANYQLENVEIYEVPGYESGSFKEIDIYASVDEQNWKQIASDVVPEYKDGKASIPLNKTTMRFLKLVVKGNSNSWVSCAEIIPYKVEGTKASATGDVNGDGEASIGDLTFMKNYIGIHDTSTTWVQVEQADINYNGMIDGYDLAFVNAWSTIHYQATSKKLSGSIVAIPSKNTLAKGEEFTVDIYGDNFNDVDGFSFELSDPENKFDIVAQAVPSAMTNNMLFYPGKDNARVMAAAVNTNEAGGQPINGTGKIATVKLRAKEETAFDMQVVNAMIVNTQYNEVDATPSFVSDETDFPEVDDSVKILSVGSDFKLTSTTSDKFNGASDLPNAADGNRNTMSELKYGGAAEMPLNYTMTLTSTKEIQKVDVVKRAGGNGELKKMQMIGYLDGAEVYNETLESAKGDEILTFTLPEGTKLDKIELNALDSHQASESTKYLTIKEIEVHGRNNSPASGIVASADNVTSMKFGSSAIFNAEVTPASALNPYYKVVSSDPDVVSVQRIQNTENGTVSYLLTTKDSTDGKSKKVTITATSEDGNFTVDQEITLYSDNKIIPHAGMKATASSQTPEGYETPGTADAVLDDNYSTYWHSDWTAAGHALPEWIQIELPEAHIINMMDFTPRINAANGYILKYEVQVSMDGENFTTAAEGNLAKNDATKVIAFDPVEAKYVRLIALEANDTGNDKNVAAVSEMNVYGLLPTIDASIEKTKLAAGESTKISVSLTPEDFFGSKKITYTSSDESILTVSEDGTITATENGGHATINVSVEGIGEIASYGITVKADPKPLADAIAALAELNEADYTPNSWSAFQSVVTKANELINKADLTKADIASMIEELNAAKETILLPVADTSNLDEVLAVAQAAIAGDKANQYTVASRTALDNAITAALLVKEDANATQEMVIEQIEAVSLAYQGLVNISVLNTAITLGEAVDQDLYLDASLEALNTAMDAARTVIAKEDASATEVNAATDAITLALGQLEKVGNKEALYKALAVANAINPDHYTSASYAEYKKAMDAAQAIADGKYAQAEIDAAVVALEKAKDVLVEAVSKVELDSLIATANTIKADNYTAESYADLTEALEAAKNVSANPDATKADVAEAVMNLRNAINNLQINDPKDPIDPEDPVNPDPEDPVTPKPEDPTNPDPENPDVVDPVKPGGNTDTNEPESSTTPVVKGQATESPKTGDTTDVNTWILVTMLGAAMLFGVKKMKNEEE